MRRGAPPPALQPTPEAPTPDHPGAASDAEDRRRSPDRLQTTFDFMLPRGYLDRAGQLHRQGTMRLATARDELLPLADDRVRENEHYLTVVLLARVLTRLGDLGEEDIHPGIIEDLFATDLAFLQDLYRRINTEGHTQAEVQCPACEERFAVDLAGGRPGGTSAP